MEKRWFNFRPLCVIFMFLLLGSLFSFFINSFSVLSIILAITIFVSALVIAVIKNKKAYFILPSLCFIIGCAGYNLAINSFKPNITEKPEIVQARIYQTSKPTDGRILVYADSVMFNNNEVGANVIIYVYDKTNVFENIKVGNIIEFSPFAKYDVDILSGDMPKTFYYNNNLKYTLLTSNVSYVGTNKNLAEKIKEQAKENLSIGLSPENVEIAYSSMFGDKTSLPTDTLQAFQLSGIAHILAVSGLHVGIIVAALAFLLKLARVKGWFRLSIIGVFLLFYCYLCNFSVSVVRASIMSIILLMAPLVNKKYDSLCSISFAGIVAYIISPLCVFDASFLMSFSCVLGIVFISKPIAKCLQKIKCPKVISGAISVCASTCISILFIQAYFFGRINLLSILTNLILIPIFTFVFEFIFIASLLSFIIPQISYILYPANYILNFINYVATIVSTLPFANFATKQFNYFAVVIYFYFLLIIGRICVANKKIKTSLSLPIAGLLIAFLV